MTSLALLGLDSIAINDALDSITSSLSVDTLIDLTLTRNALKQVPAKVQLLSQLQAITLPSNNITFVGNGTLSFRTPNLQYLDLSRNGLDTIESDAFQGIFKNLFIYSYLAISANDPLNIEFHFYNRQFWKLYDRSFL
jgi:Leucine-rich repeat (LRR) protein